MAELVNRIDKKKIILFVVLIKVCVHTTQAASLVRQGSGRTMCEVLSRVTAGDRYGEASGAEGERFQKTVRCVCPYGQVAGTHREEPACVPEAVFKRQSWCEMLPCLETEKCLALVAPSGWQCQNGDLVKRTFLRKPDKNAIEMPHTEEISNDALSEKNL